ncbi:MAG: FliA/WhiG family RNA polymerase sigma factor [Nitrospirae bacterium]|nr:MAG: FliA/WhiG family RNA polymerase sigma factor [Nitrospirota bacterium]
MPSRGYKKVWSEAEKEEVIKEMLPFIKYTAYRLAWRLPPQLTVDDLISAGIMGLLDAMQRFDESKDASLKTYAEYRIKGAMLDEIRASDWTPKHLQGEILKMKRAYASLEQELGRPPTDEELAETLNIDLNDLYKLLQEANQSVQLSLEEIAHRVDRNGNGDYDIHEHLEDLSSESPYEYYEKQEMKTRLAEAIEELPEREKLILSLYYWEELTFKEIGEVLGLSESRVCQLHGQALRKIKEILSSKTLSRKTAVPVNT